MHVDNERGEKWMMTIKKHIQHGKGVVNNLLNTIDALHCHCGHIYHYLVK